MGGHRIVRLVVMVAGAACAASIAPALAQTDGPVENQRARMRIRAVRTKAPASSEENRVDRLAREARENPGDAALLAAYGLALVNAGRTDEGITTLERASRKAPGSAEVRILHAKGLLKAQRVKEAVQIAMIVARSARSTPEEAGEAYSVAGFGVWRLGDLRKAEAYLRQALEFTPKNHGAMLNLGLLVYNTGRYSQGAELMEKAAALAPDDPRVQKTVADLYESTGQARKSLEAWERVAASRPKDGRLRMKLGSGWYALGEYAKALPHYEAAAAYLAGEPEPLLGLASVLLQLGRHDEARAAALQAKELGATVERLLALIDAAGAS